jgi:hypothetical protein
MTTHGSVRICVPTWLASIPLVATVDGHAVALNMSIPVAGRCVEVFLRLDVERDGELVSAAVHFIVPIIIGAETVVGPFV